MKRQIYKIKDVSSTDYSALGVEDVKLFVDETNDNSSGATPSLQDVTDVGNTTTNDIIVYNNPSIGPSSNRNAIVLSNNLISYLFFTFSGLATGLPPRNDYGGGGGTVLSTTLEFEDPTSINTITFKDESGTVAFLSDIIGTPTLQEVLDNNHDLESGNLFIGTIAGDASDGEYNIGIGNGTLQNNIGDYNIAIGLNAGLNNTSNGLVSIGNGAALLNTGNNVVSIGSGAGIYNAFDYVNLFGTNAVADEDGQIVFAKNDSVMARISTIELTETRKYTLQDNNGTLAFLDDVTGAFGNLSGVSEIISATISLTASNIQYDFNESSLWYHATASTNYTANFINLPTTNNRTLSVSILIEQGVTAYIPTVVKIAGVTQSLKWAGGSQSGTPNSLDLVTFTFIRINNSWVNIIGQIAPFS